MQEVGGHTFVAIASMTTAQKKALARIARLRLRRGRNAFALPGDAKTKVTLAMAEVLIRHNLAEETVEGGMRTIVCTDIGRDTHKRIEQNQRQSASHLLAVEGGIKP